ncbi:MAG: mammalian cell entry protein [Frankiales bacterium]|nr:mammalian cell entry protein [Frankiales bacterium]
MSAPIPTGGAALIRRRLSGVAFLVVLALLVGLTVLLYRKAFTPVVNVSLKADRIGNQLSAPADVKVRGLVVGEVRSVHSTGDGATIDLALQPDKVKLLPSNIAAQLLPKTLFGEKYVLLVLPTQPAATHLKSGDVIPQDRSATALETEKVLNDLMPVLQALRPAQLSETLNALSTALRGRGDKLGRNLVATGAYLKALNPSLPTLAADLQGLADFSNNTAAAAPNLLRVLDNLSASSRNLVQEKAALDTFLTSTSGFAASAQSILAANERGLVALARDSKPSLDLFATYSPEYPCLLKGLAAYEPIVEKTFGGLQPGLHITLEPILDNGGYVQGQEPAYRDTRGPYCSGLPHPPVPAGDDSFNDGYRTSTTPTGSAAAAYLAPTAGNNPVISAVSAPLLGVAAADVPELASMLLGPLAAGNAMGLS